MSQLLNMLRATSRTLEQEMPISNLTFGMIFGGGATTTISLK